jgi:hypothetical protein
MFTTVETVPQDAAAALREAAAAIFSTIPNVARCLEGLDTVVFRVLERRMLKEKGYDISACADPCEAPSYSRLPRGVRERIVPLLDAAIDASGLSFLEADAAVYAPLIEIETRRRKARLRKIGMGVRHV